ncbi:MAG: hypothetical protein E7378_00595 [Clostridiales bacterium]|nr:hypothetical protein [Clostridiales bacterium]
MGKTYYIFTKSNFDLLHNDKTFNINKNQYAKILDVDKNDTLTIRESSNGKVFELTICLSQIKSSNSIRVFEYDDCTMLEIISLQKHQPLQQIKSGEITVNIFQNSITVLHNNCFFEYYYIFQDQNYIFNYDKKLYIFNNKCIIIFDLINNIFNFQKCQKTSILKGKAEVLCNAFLHYYILYLFDFKNNSLIIKKYQKNIFKLNNSKLIFAIFYLIKNNFEIFTKFLSDKIDSLAVKNYLCKFEDIIELDGEFYVYNSQEVSPITFKTQNNVVVEID